MCCPVASQAETVALVADEECEGEDRSGAGDGMGGLVL